MERTFLDVSAFIERVRSTVYDEKHSPFACNFDERTGSRSELLHISEDEKWAIWEPVIIM